MAPERRTELLSLAKQEQEVRLRQVPPVIAGECVLAHLVRPVP